MSSPQQEQTAVGSDIVWRLSSKWPYKIVAFSIGVSTAKIESVTDPHLMERGIDITLSAKTYIQNTVAKFEKDLQHSLRVSKIPMTEGLHPELDDTPLLDASLTTKFRAIVGSLNWIVTLGRFDVMYATNTLARFSMHPREGHLIAAYKVLGYLLF